MNKLSKRLEAVAKMVDLNSTVLDIGCDHAYLPIYLINNGISNKCYASDYRELPLESAKENIKKEHLEGKISTHLSDGFKNIDFDDFDTVTICGMGANLIVDIIDGYKNKHNKTFILEANNNHEVLRNYLSQNGFEIIDENIVKDQDFFYQIIKTKYNSLNYSLKEEELLYGPILLKKKPKELKDLLIFQLNILKRAKENTSDESLLAKICLKEKILNEIK